MVGMRSRLVFLALFVAVAVGCTGGGANTPSAAPTAMGDLLPASPTALPPFDPPTFQALLDQLNGTPVVVNVWASWCGPCIEEAPALATMARTFRGQVQFLGVDIEDQMAPAKEFIERFGWTYPSVFDASGSIRDSMGLIGQPQTVFFDAEGTRVCIRSGPTDEAFLRQVLESLVRGGTASEVCPSG